MYPFPFQEVTGLKPFTLLGIHFDRIDHGQEKDSRQCNVKGLG